MATTPHSNLQSLQDVMLAMDAVDTLRHADKLVDQALDSDGRAAALVARLREIYRAQGVPVSDAVLAEGVAQAEQARYRHRPTGASWQRLLARWYIHRDRWLRFVLIVPVLVGLLYLLNGALANMTGGLTVHSTRTSADLRSAYVDAMTMADGGAMGHGNRIDALYHGGTVALEQGDKAGARRAVADLEAFSQALAVSYTLRVVDEPGKRSTVSVREPESGALRYYVLVEPLDQRGRALAVAITFPDGSQRETKRYGIEVPEQTFAAVREDQQDNGRIDAGVVGYKASYEMVPDYAMPVLQGTIAPW
ncbi:MAG: DUF6384 family protein [Pseudomonadales bacterium]